MFARAKKVTVAYNNLPRPHRFMLGSLTLLTLSIALWQFGIDYKREATELQSLEEGYYTKESHSDVDELQDQPPIDEGLPQDELDPKGETASNIQGYTISAGDTLGSIFLQYGLDMRDVAVISRQYPKLKDLKIGQQLAWTVNAIGELQTLTWNVSRRETRTFQRENNQFIETRDIKRGEWKNSVVTGTVEGSFTYSAKLAGLNSTEAHAIVKALQWQLDFRKLHKGDQFSALFTREELDGQHDKSQLLGVHLKSGGKDYYAILSDDGNYYDSKGNGLARGFLRYPTNKAFRVSSPFSPRRLHPITKRIAPHLGVDFAMPVGTPILAVGDGEVIVSKKSGAAGNYITIRHGRQYTTRYMHLKTSFVKPGQKVKKGERIALSGNTGRSTGPHLHYEFWVNNQPVDPLKVKLPQTQALSGKARAEFLEQVKQIIPQLIL